MSEQHDKKQSGWKHQQTQKGWHFPQQKEQHGERQSLQRHEGWLA